MPFDSLTDTRVALLERGRALLHEYGHCQGMAYDGGKMCLVSAIHEASREINGRLLDWKDYHLGPFPAPWNDESRRTMADIDGWFDERIGEILK